MDGGCGGAQPQRLALQWTNLNPNRGRIWNSDFPPSKISSRQWFI